MKRATLAALTMLGTLTFAHAASASQYKGKCAKQAEEAAITNWADVANPDPNLEYLTVSSLATAARSDTYEVVLALSDGNETSYAKYEVKFASLGACKGATVSAAK
jgi:hypothetical protein